MGKHFSLSKTFHILSYSSYTYSTLPHPNDGLNSGVMLMNLENMRNENWNDKILIMFEELQSSMAFCDQDIVNIYSYYYPSELEMLPCSANYRPDFCLSGLFPCSIDSILMLHGARAAFHENWQFGGSFLTSYLPKMMNWFLFKNLRLVDYAFAIRNVNFTKQKIFQIVYQTFNEFEVDIIENNLQNLKQVLKQKLDIVTSADICYPIIGNITNIIP